jgi:transposase, IS5 family
MLQDRYEIDKLFDSILKLTNQMDPVLAEIDQLLEDEALYQLIRNDLAKRYPMTEQTGRNSTPVEVILRILAVKRLYGLSYEQTEYQVRDSLVLRKFCRVYFNEVPDDTTLIRWAGLIQPETLERFNHRLTQLATQLKVTKGRKLRTDGTVVETNIHHPSDSSLLADSVRVLGRTLGRARSLLQGQTDLSQEVFRNRLRSGRKLARQVGEAMRKSGETAREQGLRAYRKLVKTTQQTIAQAQQVLPALQVVTDKQAGRLSEVLETFIPRAEQVVSQTVRRVFQGEKVPASEKIVSLFEPHSAIIRRNKARKPTEYGHKVWLDEVDGGIVTRWQVLEGNPNDDQQWLPSLEHHIECFGRPPNQMSADRGVHSSQNEQIAQQRGVKRVILPQPGRKSEARKRHEKQRWFQRGRRWHAGVEGRISVLKRRNELDRCRDHGVQGFDRWVGWGVIANNLTVMGRKAAVKA